MSGRPVGHDAFVLFLKVLDIVGAQHARRPINTHQRLLLWAVHPPDVHEPPEVHCVNDGVYLAGKLVVIEGDAEVSTLLFSGHEPFECHDSRPDARHIK